MQIRSVAEDFYGFTRIRVVESLDQETLDAVLKKFQIYVNKGLVVDGTFGDDIWLLSNEVVRRSIRFAIPKNKTIAEWTGCKTEVYKTYVKAYIVLLFGERVIETLIDIAKMLMALGTAEFEEACIWDINTVHALQFLDMIPEEAGFVASVMEHVEENRTLGRWRKNPRSLSGFHHYLRFDKEMNSFWNQADDKTKDRFFPVHLWWKLTSVLPLRATEFLLLPEKCVDRHQGKYILTVRRTKLKKSKGRIGYRIEEDYSRHDYEIPDWLAEEILEYKGRMKQHIQHKKDTLFAPLRESELDYMTYEQMKRLLAQFCKEVLHDADYPVNLGDTRHLAMINLILSGGSPVICRELAGHESIDISSNYYANLSTVVESVAYETYYTGKDEVCMEGSLKVKTNIPSAAVSVEGGVCDAVEITKGDVSECMKNFSTQGRFGECRGCIHFYPDGLGIRLKTQKKCKEMVDADGTFLMNAIDQVRKGNGAQEDITQALLRLQNSSTNYKEILMSNWEGEENHGQTKENK